MRNEINADPNDISDDEADKDMDSDDEDNNHDTVNGPTVLAHVELARTVCKYFVSTPSTSRLLLKILLQIAEFLSLILLRKLTNLTSLTTFDDSFMISYIPTATSLHLTCL
jgi:hypothetical protein